MLGKGTRVFRKGRELRLVLGEGTIRAFTSGREFERRCATTAILRIIFPMTAFSNLGIVLVKFVGLVVAMVDVRDVATITLWPLHRLH